MVIFSWPLFGTLTYDWSKFFNPFTPEPKRKKKNEERKVRKRRGEKVKSDNQDCCVIFKPKNYPKFCFLYMPELCKLIFYIWIRRPRSV